MSLKVYAFTCGHLTGELGHLMEGGEGRIRLPIPAYLIEHPKGTALFDTGMHPDCQHDPAARLGARLTDLFDFDYRPGEEISARLTALDRDPGRIDLIINSHFHSTMSAATRRSRTRRCWCSAANGMPAWIRTAPLSAAAIRAISISATSFASSMASTMCSATARWCACQPTGTRRGINR